MGLCGGPYAQRELCRRHDRKIIVAARSVGEFKTARSRLAQSDADDAIKDILRDGPSHLVGQTLVIEAGEDAAVRRALAKGKFEGEPPFSLAFSARRFL